ncbi:MAG: HD domain-containing protein [Anaerolineales bacterium]|nr:HD domain-containing protein [Anaerolineales bacterium]
MPKSSRVWLPLRFKITIPYLVLAFVLAMGVSYIVTRLMFDTTEERFHNQLVEAGKLGAEWMVREESRLLETLRMLAFTEELGEAIQRGDANRIRELAYPVVTNQGEEAVEILDSSGHLLLSLHHRTGGNVEDYEFSQEPWTAFETHAFVQKVFNQYLDNLGDKYAGVIRSEQQGYFYVTGPVYHNGNLVGVILVGKTLDSIANQVRQETLTQVTLYDFDGQPMKSTFYNPQQFVPETAAEVIDHQNTTSNVRSLEVANIEYSEILGPWEVRSGLDLGLIGISLPETFLVHASSVTRLQILLYATIALLMITLMGMALANNISRPISTLVKASTKVAKGDLTTKVKPVGKDEVTILTESFNTMVENLRNSRLEILEAYDSTLFGWAKALELRDKETEGHAVRVANMTMRLAQSIGIQNGQLIHIRRGAMLHDIGKMGIPDDILLKPDSLTDAEWDIMRNHPIYAYDMLSKISYLRPALDIPLYHHERWDGSGYPRGLKGEQIPLAARIFAVVDVWDALRSDRPYRLRWPEAKVRDYLIKNRGILFDPKVVTAFISMLDDSDKQTVQR